MFECIKIKGMMKVWKPLNTEIIEAEKWGIWSREVSKFFWKYDEKETSLIIEGLAKVTDIKGNKISFKAGDMVQFEVGLECTWHI